MLFPQSTLDQALVGMERLRARLGGLAVSASVPDPRVTFSAGMASADAAESLSLLLERADRALYAAKSAGRNQRLCDRAGRG